MKVYSKSLEENKKRDVLLTCSIERVIKTAIRVARESKHEDANLCVDDLESLEEILVDLWNEARNSIYIDQMILNNDPLGFALRDKEEQEEAKRRSA